MTRKTILYIILIFIGYVEMSAQTYASPYENFVTALEYDKEGKCYTRAFELYSAAAKEGETRAMNNMAVMYAFGYGVGKDIDKAVSTFKEAAFKGDAFAMENYGMCLMLGYGCIVNESEASMWFNKAEDAGYWDMANAYTYNMSNEILSDGKEYSVQFVVYTQDDLIP